MKLATWIQSPADQKKIFLKTLEEEESLSSH